MLSTILWQVSDGGNSAGNASMLEGLRPTQLVYGYELGFRVLVRWTCHPRAAMVFAGSLTSCCKPVLQGLSKNELQAFENGVVCPAGIVNLMMVILMAANSRLMIENLMKYGILINPIRLTSRLAPQNPTSPLLLACWVWLGMAVLAALGIEKLGMAILGWEMQVWCRNS